MPEHNKDQWRRRQAFKVAIEALCYQSDRGYHFHPSNVNDEQLKAAKRYSEELIKAGCTDPRLMWLRDLIKARRPRK